MTTWEPEPPIDPPDEYWQESIDAEMYRKLTISEIQISVQHPGYGPAYTTAQVRREYRVHSYGYAPYDLTRASLLRCQRAQLALMERGK